MLTLILGLLLWIPAIVGWGFPACSVRKKLTARKYPLNIDLIEPITGFVLVTGFVLTVNFLIPISGTVRLFALSTGWVGLIWRVRKFGKPTIDWRLMALGIGWLIIVSLLSSGFTGNYDTGLYHIQTIKWLQENLAPFGLANLHGRFGFNSTWFALASVVSFPEYSTSYSLLPALLVWLWGMVFISSGIALLNFDVSGRFHNLFALLTPTIFLSPTFRGTLSSPTPDLPALLLTLLLIALVLKAEPGKISRYQIWETLLIAIFVITIKFSTIPLLLIPLSLLFVNLWHNNIKIKQSVSFVSIIFPLTLLIPWLIRSVVLSGCLAYPLNSTCFHSLPWAVPGEKVELEAAWIQSWARTPYLPPHEVLANWDWLGDWVTRTLNLFEFKSILFALMLGIIIFAVAKLISENDTPTYRKPLSLSILPMMVSIIGIVYWFVTAPELRFGAGYLWSLGLLILCHAIYRLLNGKPVIKIIYWQAIRFSIISLVIIFVLSGLFGTILKRTIQTINNPQTIVTTSAIPTPEFNIRQTVDNINIYQPVETDQCWGEALPCTPDFNKNLRVIKNSDGQFVTLFYP